MSSSAPQDILGLTELHFESELARTVFDDVGRDSAIPSRLRGFLDVRLLAWAQKCSSDQAQAWAAVIDATFVPRLSPAGFRRFCAIWISRHGQTETLSMMPNTRNSCAALARAVYLSQHINAPVLNRILSALKEEGLN